MSAYGDGERTLHVVDRTDDCLGWQVHPDERLARTSHAIATDDGLWLLDPLDAPGLDESLAEYGDVAGVLVCSSWHARDAGELAARHGVPVSVPTWLDRVAERVETETERRLDAPGAFRFRASNPLPSWQEAILHRERDGTLYVPESIGTSRFFRVGDERLGVSLYRRLLPPRAALADLDPDRILVGHGDGITENAGGELAHALANARRRAPRAMFEHGPAAVSALWDSQRH
ncbi:hypothetical protein GJ629_02650 [Halapricum sp. CBA1109]|uniref:hypothetical protein n=1 Tax=Halapricum sp. CBA1109 TaxID=2668068 RepID=UPI0012F95C2E|nr:hypothetical protein [Halapricum sp. CBA1109]MUV88928.1 hypothetical protein [Halapricum sp. CBA1109]